MYEQNPSMAGQWTSICLLESFFQYQLIYIHDDLVVADLNVFFRVCQPQVENMT